MTNKGLDMSIKDDQDRCRSLVCDPNGIIVAEMVYRCMICFYVNDTMSEARQHYALKHIEEDDLSNENCVDQCDDLDDLRHSKNNIPRHVTKKQLQNNNNSTKYQNGNRSNSLDSNGLDSYSPVNGSNKYRNSSAEPIDMSPSSDSFDRYLPLVTISDETGSNNATTKSGYVNCAVCNVTRYYSCVQRRYGQYTCVTCYRYFKTFFEKPERYSCPNLGKCLLSVRNRCRACWIKSCIDVFQVDLEKQQLIDAFAPVKHGGISASSVNNSEEDDEHLDGLDSSSLADDKMDHSDDNNNSINNGLTGLNGHMNHSKEALSMMLALNGGADLPTLLGKSSLNGFGLLTGANTNNLFGNLNDNNNNSLINHTNNSFGSLNNSNALNGLTNGLNTSDSSNALSFLTTPKRNHQNNKNQNSSNGQLNGNNNLNGTNLSVDSLKSSLESSVLNSSTKDSNNNKSTTASANKQTKGTSGKKVWSCGKCATCMAEDCGKCIYCLDRPKFGGPFVKKQRCIKRRCLMKIKTKAANKAANNAANLANNNLATNLTTNTSYVY